MRTVLAVLSIASLVCGCATSVCDKPQSYQQARPVEPLVVPGDLSAPPERSRAPAVTPVAPRRADGRCLEEPPDYVPPAKEDDQGSS